MKRTTRKMFLFVLCCLVVMLSSSLTVQAAAKKPAKPKITSVKKVSNTAIQVKWKKAKNARKYELYVAVNGAKYKKLKTTKALTYKHTKLKSGKTYAYKVRALNGKKKSAFSTVKQLKLKAAAAKTTSTSAKPATPTPQKTTQASVATYGIGQTWVVPGQWKFMVNSVEEMDERNPYADKSPAAVYLVTYTYENLGYVDGTGLMNGLYLSLDLGTVVDAQGYTGYDYPNSPTYYPQETPVGAKCVGQSCIGVDHAGSFKVHFAQYDGNSVEQKAIFSIAVD